MKLRTLIVVSALFLPGVVSAASLVCTFNSDPLSCLTPSSYAFTDSLLWTSAGSAYESAAGMSVGTTPMNNSALAISWTGTSVDATNSVTITDMGGVIGRADEAPWVYAGPPVSGWTQPGTNGIPNLLVFQGPFLFSTSTVVMAADSTTHDVGTALVENMSNADPDTLTFSENLTAFGVDISSLGNVTDFTATLVAYDSSHDVLGTYTLDTNGTKVGGTCASLGKSPSHGGAGCNDAPFIAIGGTGWQISYVVISVTNDATGKPVGFALDGPLFSEGPQVPEPGAWLLAACGLAAMVWHRRRTIGRAR